MKKKQTDVQTDVHLNVQTDVHLNVQDPSIIAVVSDKGGVAKTTTVVHLGHALSRLGLKVLIIDLDPQGDTSHQFLANKTIPGAAELLGVRPALPLSQTVQARPGLDLVSSSAALQGADLVLFPMLARERRLAQALAGKVRPYHVVLIDTPASLSMLTVNAMVAADFILTPIQGADLSLQAIPRVQQMVSDVKPLNPRLAHLGFILSMVDNRERQVGEARELMRQHLGALLWRTEVRIDSTLKAHPKQLVRRRHATEDFAALAAELVQRVPALQAAAK